MKFTVVVAIALAATMAAGACGSESTGEKAFGDLTSGDKDAMKRMQREIRDFPVAQAALIRAFGRADVRGARSAVERLFDSTERASDLVLDFDNNELRTTMDEYTEKLDRYVLAADRFVTYYEGPGPADPSLENDLLIQLENATLAAQRADRQFLNTLIEVAEPEERDRLRRSYRSLLQRFERQAGLSP